MNGTYYVGRFAVMLVAGWGASWPASAAVIGVDAVHGFDDDAVLAFGGNFDTFRATITELGHSIVPMTSFESGDLAGLDALFASQPYAQNGAGYTASEMAAIVDFVDSGGGLVVTGDGGGGANIPGINALVAPFGIDYADAPTEGNGHTITGFVDHAVTQGLSSIGVDFQLRITTEAPSLDLTLGSGADDALSVWAMGGRAVFLSDTSLWMDEDAGSDRPITFGDNQLLLENIIGYVPEPSATVLLGVGAALLLGKRR